MRRRSGGLNLLGSRDHGVDLVIDALVLLSQLGGQVIELLLVLIVDCGKDESADPGENEEAEGVEHRAHEREDVHEDTELDALDVVLHQDETLEAVGDSVELLGGAGDEGLDLLGGEGDLDVPDAVQGVSAGLLEESHEVDVDPGGHSDQEDGEEGVGDHGDQGELDQGDEDGEAGHQGEAGGRGVGPHPEAELLGLVNASISNNYTRYYKTAQ